MRTAGKQPCGKGGDDEVILRGLGTRESFGQAIVINLQTKDGSQGIVPVRAAPQQRPHKFTIVLHPDISYLGSS